MRLPYEGEEQWHALRARHSGASEVPIYYGLGYLDLFQHWHIKRGTLPRPDLSDDERVRIGRHFEPSIAAVAVEKFGVELRKVTDYYEDDACPRLGASLDYELADGEEVYPAEIKNVSWGSWSDHRIVHDDYSEELPLRYSLQLQAQMLCTGAPRGYAFVCIAGDRIEMFEIERHEAVCDDIRKRVTAFWESIENNEEPDPNFERDLEAMKAAWRAGSGEVDLCGDPAIEAPLDQIGELRAQRKRYEAEIAGLEARVLAYCVKHGYSAVRANAGRVSVRNRPAKPEHLVTYRAQPEKIEMRITPAKI